MTTKTFDRDTLLDLTVNFVPLFIILFFVVVFLLFAPWDGGLLGTVIQFGLLLVPFAALAVLTYLSGKAIAGSEKEGGEVYYQGQSLVEGAETREGSEEAESRESETAEPEGDGTETSADAAEEETVEDEEN